MPTPAHTRITWSGTIGPEAAPLEIWSFSLNHDLVLFPADDYAAAAALMRTAWVNKIAGQQHSNVALTRVRVANIDADGHVVVDSEGAYQQGDSLGRNAGEITGSGFYPLQVALCVSLMTGRAGPTGKGRFYLPGLPKPLVEATFAYNPTDIAVVATKAKEFIALVNSGVTTDSGGVVVASSKGYLSPVTGVRVGTVPDTMRSRRGALPEVYSTVAL